MRLDGPAARTPGGVFTSGLSVPALLSVQGAGLETVALVAGAAVCRVGWQVPAWARSEELEMLTAALSQARAGAMRRLQDEAARFGADGVVGVRLEERPLALRQRARRRLIEFAATGTAVRLAGPAPCPSGAVPFVTPLTGPEVWALLRVGYRPLGLANGGCVFHVGYQGAAAWAGQIGRNMELPLWTQAVAGARELALGRMQDAARLLGADVLLGVRLEQGAHGWGRHVLEYFAHGTALRAPKADPALPAPVLALPLTDADPAPPPLPSPKDASENSQAIIDAALAGIG